MKILMLALITVMTLIPTVLFAQPRDINSPTFAPVDKELWDIMERAFAKLSMPLEAHQQVQAIMQSMQRTAQERAALKVLQNKPPEVKAPEIKIPEAKIIEKEQQ